MYTLRKLGRLLTGHEKVTYTSVITKLVATVRQFLVV